MNISLNNENVIDGNSNECIESANIVIDQSSPIDNDTLMLQTKYICNEHGTIQQANEIKSLRLQLKRKQAKVNMLTTKYKNEKLLRLKMSRETKFYKRKCSILSTKLEKIPILKEFAAGLSNLTPRWSPQCLKLATQIRYAGNFFNF